MTKLEQAAREVVRQHSMECLSDKAVDALREALADQAKGAIVKTCPDGYGTIKTEQAEQEPVVKIHKYNEFQTLGSLNLPIGTKLYAAPVRTKDLTDAELHHIWRDIKSLVGLYSFQEIARAVIAADREKNK